MTDDDRTAIREAGLLARGTPYCNKIDECVRPISHPGGCRQAPRIRIDTSDPETKAIWETAKQAAVEVAAWPAWKRGDSVEPSREQRLQATRDIARAKLRAAHDLLGACSCPHPRRVDEDGDQICEMDCAAHLVLVAWHAVAEDLAP
jgi:hypothetical protein